MKMKELKQKTKKELEELLNANREKLGRLKFDLKSKKVKNVHEIKGARKDIARLIFMLKEIK